MYIFHISRAVNLSRFAPRYRLLHLHKASFLRKKNRVDVACITTFFSSEFFLPSYEMQMSIARYSALGAFSCCIVVALRIRNRIDIFARGFAISDQACRRDTVVHVDSTSPTVSQLLRIFVSLTGIEEPVLQPGLRSRARMKLWFPDAETFWIVSFSRTMRAAMQMLKMWMAAHSIDEQFNTKQKFYSSFTSTIAISNTCPITPQF